jgi:hypothetical protein
MAGDRLSHQLIVRLQLVQSQENDDSASYLLPLTADGPYKDSHQPEGWFERRGELNGGGQRVSRQLLRCVSPAGLQNKAAEQQVTLKWRHAKIFFNRPDLDLASAAPRSFALTRTTTCATI